MHMDKKGNWADAGAGTPFFPSRLLQDGLRVTAWHGWIDTSTNFYHFTIDKIWVV